jgi:hypothetical protein
MWGLVGISGTGTFSARGEPFWWLEFLLLLHE